MTGRSAASHAVDTGSASRETSTENARHPSRWDFAFFFSWANALFLVHADTASLSWQSDPGLTAGGSRRQSLVLDKLRRRRVKA